MVSTRQGVLLKNTVWLFDCQHPGDLRLYTARSWRHGMDKVGKHSCRSHLCRSKRVNHHAIVVT